MISKQLRQQWKEDYCKEWFQFILDNPKYNRSYWDYDYLSENPNITFDIVQNNPEIGWDYEGLSKNPNTTFDIIKNN